MTEDEVENIEETGCVDNIILNVFEVDTLNTYKVNYAKVIFEAIGAEINKKAEELGVTVRVEEIISPEQFVSAYYVRQGYHVLRLQPTRYGWSSTQIPEELRELLYTRVSRVENGLSFLFESGVPDLIVWKDREFFFVEAKSASDSLRINQFIWIWKYKMPTKIVFANGA